MRIVTALLLAVLLLALPACQMNERMSGAVFGGGGGAVLGGVVGGTFAGALVGGLAGGVLGYIVGDYLADKRERCAPPCVDPCAPPCPQPTYAPAPCAPQYAPQYAPPQYQQAPCAPPAGYGVAPRVGAVKALDPSRAAIERGRRAATLPEAKAAYEEAVRLDPRSPDAWNALGLALRASGDAVGAREAFGRALDLDPRHFAAKRNLDWATTGAR